MPSPPKKKKKVKEIDREVNLSADFLSNTKEIDAKLETSLVNIPNEEVNQTITHIDNELHLGLDLAREQNFGNSTFDKVIEEMGAHI